MTAVVEVVGLVPVLLLLLAVVVVVAVAMQVLIRLRARLPRASLPGGVLVRPLARVPELLPLASRSPRQLASRRSSRKRGGIVP